MGGKKARDLGQHRQHGGRRRGPRAHGRTELAQEQDRRRLAGVVGGLPVPGAVGVGAAEGGLHRRAERRRIDALAAFEMGKKMLRGLASASAVAGASGASGSGAAAKAAAEAEVVVMEGTSGERERVEPRGALSRPHRLKPVPAVLSLSGRPRRKGSGAERRTL